jgi:hypothetical protein
MDIKNRFHTDSTFFLVRAEHVAVVIICVALAVAHFHQLDVWRFALAFVAIDAIGYIPGAVRFRRQGGGVIPPIYHHLYNVMHSYLTAAAVVGLWAYAADGLEWAMLALPIHLSGDRGLFGNTYKPSSLSFEPVAALRSAPEQAR